MDLDVALFKAVWRTGESEDRLQLPLSPLFLSFRCLNPLSLPVLLLGFYKCCPEKPFSFFLNSCQLGNPFVSVFYVSTHIVLTISSSLRHFHAPWTWLWVAFIQFLGVTFLCTVIPWLASQTLSWGHFSGYGIGWQMRSVSAGSGSGLGTTMPLNLATALWRQGFFGTLCPTFPVTTNCQSRVSLFVWV